MEPAAPLHPLFVHLPLALAMLLPLLLGILWVSIRAKWLPLRAWTLAIAAQAALVGGCWLAMQTGEQDAERVERVATRSAMETTMETHEERAELLFGVGIAVLLLTGLPLLTGRLPRVGAVAAYASIAASVGVLALAWSVGSSGGKLVYEHGAAAVWSSAATAPAALGERERHDH